MTETVLSIEGLNVSYEMGPQTLLAVRDFNLTVDRGEIVGVLGESGCGKSTLGMTIPGLLPANGSISSGRIVLEGDDLTQFSDSEMRAVRGARIGMIFQDPLTSLNPVFPVGSQMVAAKRAHQSGPKRALRDEARAALTEVGIPDAERRLGHYPHEFSGGMNQRIMIATALSLRPSLLIADEPTSALDATLQMEIVRLLMSMRETAGSSIIIISHDPVVLARACDRLLVMYAGEVVEEAPTREILENPKHPYTRALLEAFPTLARRSTVLPVVRGQVPPLWERPSGCAFVDRCSHALASCHEVTPTLVEAGGSMVRCLLYSGAGVPLPPIIHEPVVTPGVQRQDPHSAEPPEDALVEVKDLKVHFASRRSLVATVARRPDSPVRAVDGVDLTIGHAEIVGLVGESGSGKTTLGRAVLGLLKPTAGAVVVDGRDLSVVGRREMQQMRSRMQLISQDAYGSLSPRKRIDHLLMSPYEIHDTPQEVQYTAQELLEMVELRPDLARKYPHELSGGQARRVSIARALALRPSLVVADEPTAGLDALAAASVLNLLRSLRDHLDLALLIITHDLNVVGFLADRVAVMYLGRIVEVAPTPEILLEPTHPYTRALEAAHVASQRAGDPSASPALSGEIPSPINPPPGCRFHTRCPSRGEGCDTIEPINEPVRPGHLTACHHWRQFTAADSAMRGC